MSDEFEEQVSRMRISKYAWVRGRQLEGTFDQGPFVGLWPITQNRVMRGWGNVPERYYSYKAGSWPPPDPSKLDEAAKQLRASAYTRVWSSHDCLRTFERGLPVSACFRISHLWENPPEGRLDFDQSQEQILGGHCVTIHPPFRFASIPIEWREESCFAVQNWWGKEWGIQGWGAMPHEVFDRENYEAWAIEPATFPTLYGSGIQHVPWTVDKSAQRAVFAYDIVDMDSDDRLAWAIIVHRRGELHVEDLYVKPEQRGKGYGSRILEELDRFAERMEQPLRFWIPFGDVEDREKYEHLAAWFASRAVKLISTPYPWAACCGVRGIKTGEIPEVEIPPKPAFTFAKPMAVPNVDWLKIQENRGVGCEFIEAASDVFERHDGVLRRLS